MCQFADRALADGGLIPLEYIVEELEDEIVQHAVESSSSSSLGKRERRPSKKATVKRERDLSDEEDDGGDDGDEEEEEEEQRGGKGSAVGREQTGGGGGGGGGGKTVVDITEYLNLPQSDAAAKLGLPVSTLSKRWKEAAKNRKWPFRKVAKLDKEIAALLQAVPQSGVEAGILPGEVETQLTAMLKERAVDLRKISIRL